MSITCFIDRCKNPVNSVCFCRDQPIYICNGHMYTHTGSSHNLKNPNKLINKFEKERFINQFNNFKKREQQYKTTLLTVLKKVINSFNQMIDEVNKRISLIKSHTLHIKENEFILLRLDATCLDNQLLTEKDVRCYFNSIRTPHDIQSIFKETISNIEEFPQYFEVNDALYFIKHISSDLVKVDLSSFSSKVIPIKLDTHKLSCSTVLRVDELKLFIHGGYDSNNRYSSFTYYFDLIKLNLNKLPSFPGRSNAMGLKFSDHIYLFGGLFNGNPLKHSAYFDTQNGNWFAIPDLPSPVYNTSQLVLDDKILISGFPGNFLQLFYLEEKFYFNLEAGLSFDGTHVLFEFEGSIFLICQWFYVNKSKNYDRWQRVGKAQIGIGNIATNPVIRNEFAYFVDMKGIVYQFNCRDYEIGIVFCCDSEIRKSLYQSKRK